MNKKDNYEQTLKTIIVGTIFLIIFVFLYTMTMKTNDEILIILTSCITGAFVLMNLILVSKNKSKTNKMRKIILKKEVTSIKNNPLEVYFINKIWYHKKGNINAKQVYSMLLYSISSSYLVYNDNKLKINNNFNLLNLSSLEKLAIEMSFLNSIEFKQNIKLKEEKLLKLQNDNIYLQMEDLKKNITSNCKNKTSFYDAYTAFKSNYFVDIEGNKEAILTIISWITIILEFVLGINYINNGTILNFYLPISLALILTGLVTNKFRERVILRVDKKDEITDILNYIKYIDNNQSRNIDKIYLYALNKLSEKDEIAKIFDIE